MAETWVSWLSRQDTLTNFIVFLVVLHLLAVVSFREGITRFDTGAGLELTARTGCDS
jgi:hypothetical protein